MHHAKVSPLKFNRTIKSKSNNKYCSIVIPEGRIIGGIQASQGQFPYVASLQDSTYGHICSVSIINTQWVLTAATCTFGRFQHTLTVRVGSHIHSSGGIQHQIADIRIHPSYNVNFRANDISTIKTAHIISFNWQTQSIPLASQFYGISNAIITGWGQTNVSLLLIFQIEIIDHSFFFL